MIDLDHFKNFNDTYGHSVGDEVLKATAQAVATVVRGKGEAYRYGGEEISVILPNHALVEAAAVAERIRNEIERVRINSNPDVSATASIGVVSIWVTPRWQSQQHRMLVDLENTGQQVYYAAPIFHLQTAFNAEFQGNTVVNRSVFISPAEISYLADDNYRSVVFNDLQAYFCSEPQKLRLHTGSSLKEFLAAQKQALKPTSTLDVASALYKITSSTDNRVPPFLEPSAPVALEYISFVAHVVLHSEVFFVPAVP